MQLILGVMLYVHSRGCRTSSEVVYPDVKIEQLLIRGNACLLEPSLTVFIVFWLSLLAIAQGQRLYLWNSAVPGYNDSAVL